MTTITIQGTPTHAMLTLTNDVEVPAVRRNGRWERLGSEKFPEPITSWTIASARPLVVIDPADSTQVNRLATLLRDDLCNHDSYLYDARLAILLEQFTSPISEPPNLGAVVEDNAGKHWVRDAAFNKRWYNAADGKRADFDEIGAVRCLSYGAEGVQR